MFINPAQLLHDFQNVEWLVQRWMICNYDVKCILTTLNDLYTIYDTLNALHYVEWFALTWIICNYNVGCVLTTLKDLHCCWMIWTVQWNFPWKIFPKTFPRNFLLHENPNNEHRPIRKPPLMKISLVKTALHQTKKQTIFKI